MVVLPLITIGVSADSPSSARRCSRSSSILFRSCSPFPLLDASILLMTSAPQALWWLIPVAVPRISLLPVFTADRAIVVVPISTAATMESSVESFEESFIESPGESFAESLACKLPGAAEAGEEAPVPAECVPMLPREKAVSTSISFSFSGRISTSMPSKASVRQARRIPSESSCSVRIDCSVCEGAGAVPNSLTRHLPQDPFPPQGAGIYSPCACSTSSTVLPSSVFPIRTLLCPTLSPHAVIVWN